MNDPQRLWWEQVVADHAELGRLRKAHGAPCHQLHYLQMVTEKLAKAYLWRSGTAPPKSHVSFVNLLKALLSRRKSDAVRIPHLLGFGTAAQFEAWARAVLPLAYELERLAPSLARDGPNPEYPWPYEAPRFSPASFQFPIWTVLTETAHGRRLLRVIDVAVHEFPRIC